MPVAPKTITEIAIDAAIAAAKVICDVYHRPIAVEVKPDGSPVTEADQAAEAVIIEHLQLLGLPILGEESVSAGIVPDLGERYFIVDPLDGTKEFIKRNGEFTVNIGLIENGRPTMGIVLAPVTGEIFVGDSNGVWKANTAGGTISDRKSISVEHRRRPNIVASRSHGHSALEHLCQVLNVERDISVGSSLKFCLLAQGDAQLYPRFTPTCEWDTAAGQAVLEAAGGAVLTLDGEPLRYGKAHQSFLNPFFVAAASSELAVKAAAEMRSLLS